MDDGTTLVRIGEDGQLTLPSTHRRALGLERGGMVMVRVEGAAVRLVPIESALREAQELAAEYFAGSGESVDRFLAERRQEWGE